MGLRIFKWLLLLLSCGLASVESMEDVWVELRAPRFVVHGHNAVMRCEHNVDPQTLYKVVFFKSGQRIMQYVQGRDPPFELYNFTGADINLIKMTPTSLTLERMDFAAAGPYACEIALEIPLYSKASKIHEVSVIVRQKYRPKIKIKHKKLSSNDDLEATCQSSPAYPAPHLTWLINNVKVTKLQGNMDADMQYCVKPHGLRFEKMASKDIIAILHLFFSILMKGIMNEMQVDERLTIPHGTVNVHRHHHGMPLTLTNSSLRYPLPNLQLFPNQSVEITCLSTIPSYANLNEGFADVQNHTVTVNVIRMEPAPTQLPVKIITVEKNKSNDLGICRRIIGVMLIVAVLNVMEY